MVDFFRKLRLIDYGLNGFGRKAQNFLPQTLSSLKVLHEILKIFPKYKFFAIHESKRFSFRVFNFATWRPIREIHEHF